MKDEKIAVFPVDEDFLFLPNNQCIMLGEEKHSISYYLTLAGWNIGNSEKPLYTIDDFDFKKISTLVLVNSFRILESEVLQKIVNIVAHNGIKIICARDDMDIDEGQLQGKCIEKNIEYSFICEETSLAEHMVMHNIEVPVITIAGIGPYVEKFKLGLHIRNAFEDAGYKILYISPRREGKLFATHIFPEYMYKKDLDFARKVLSFNVYVNSLVAKEQPDILLVGVPGETMELSEKHKMNFGILASAVFNAVKPDVSILNVYNLRYTDKFLDEQKKYCKYRLGMIPDLFYATYTGIIESSLQESWIQYFHADRLFNDLLEKHKLFSEVDLTNGLLFKQIMSILEEYGSLEFM
jgi:hypothetical protein